MAPAAKASANGSTGCMYMTATAPTTPATGSTIAESCPNQKLRKRETPWRRSGKATATPSGKFWRPIPMARATAAPREAPSIPAA